VDISHRQQGEVDILGIDGRLDAATAPLLRSKIEGLFAEARARIVLDMRQLEYVSSPGLRVLIEARKRARDIRVGDVPGDVRIVGLPERIKEVFELTGFISLFSFFDDVDAAVASF
jgi:anti-sigma B factor antagonist